MNDIRPKRVCSPKYAVQKARKGAKLNKWELEDLAKDSEWALQYALKVLKGRFPEGEAAIAQQPDHAFEYAREVLKGRFEQAEETLLKYNSTWGNRSYASKYFIRFKVRNPKVEKIILNDEPALAVDYAENCVGGRWPEAERSILKDWERANDYHRRIVKGRWPEFERSLFNGKKSGFWANRSKSFAEYLEVIGDRSLEIENKLLASSRASLLFVYAAKAAKGKLPSLLHQKMMMFSFDPKKQRHCKRYIKFLESREDRVVSYLAGLEDEDRVALLDRARTKQISK